ncbi:uncharacterized protein At4g15970 [Rutidosis leptorrhynchoides]|uniref:uncharacterized protein At4g15970 n=1 Tax=Rutidosis leptorrhynchoides TaxID=125765 RepID=UPI003A9A3DCC
MLVFEKLLLLSRRTTPRPHHRRRPHLGRSRSSAGISSFSSFRSSSDALPLSSSATDTSSAAASTMLSGFSSRGRTLISVVAIIVCCFFLYHATVSERFNSSTVSLFDSFLQENEESKLDRVLKSAAMKSRTVILTTLNEAWATQNSVIDLFLESFRNGVGTRKLLKHLVIIALDEKAYNRCLLVHSHCYALVTEGVDFNKEAYFMTPSYLKMMWRRIDLLRSVLEMGYNFVFTDADIMWFRDPFPRFYDDADFQIACDQFLGDPDEILNRPNGGFNYVKSNNRTIEFYKFWYFSRETYPEYHDQDVFNRIKYDPFIDDIGLTIKFLDTTYFGGLCEPSKDLNLVCTMHANCCFGLESKLIDLRVMLEDWKTFKSWPLSLKRSLMYSWNVPQNCR